MTSPDIERRAYRVSEFCEAYRIGRNRFYEEVKAGRLHVRKVGTRTLVLASDAEQWAGDLPEGG